MIKATEMKVWVRNLDTTRVWDCHSPYFHVHYLDPVPGNRNTWALSIGQSISRVDSILDTALISVMAFGPFRGEASPGLILHPVV